MQVVVECLNVADVACLAVVLNVVDVDVDGECRNPTPQDHHEQLSLCVEATDPCKDGISSPISISPLYIQCSKCH
jgi:hypothetical protein